MTPESTAFLAAVLKSTPLNGHFAPEDIGRKLGIEKHHALAAARSLANDGILSIGFDDACHFTPEYRKAQARLKPPTKTAPDSPASPKPARRPRKSLAK